MSDNTDTAIPEGGEEIESPDINDTDIKSMQDLRKKFIGQLAPNGQFPTDVENRNALLSLMKATTSSAVAMKKIKADAKAVMSQAQTVKNLAEIVRIQSSQAAAANRTRRQAQLDVPTLKVSLVPGQTDVGCIPVSTAAIMNSTSSNQDS